MNVTESTPVRFVPLIVTSAASPPLDGEKLVIVGEDAGRVTVKFDALVTVPSRAVTTIGPVVAPAGTVAEIRFVVSTLKGAAATPPIDSAVIQRKFDPLIVTAVPMLPLEGVNDEMPGGESVRVKFVALVAVPRAVTIEIGPLVKPGAGTLAVTCVVLFTANEALTIPNLTRVTSRKSVPVITTGALT